MAEILKGAPAANGLSEELKKKSDILKEEGIIPKLAILRVGEDPSDMAYERGALKRCEKTGVEPKQIILPADCSKEELLAAIKAINEDDSIHGCLMFRPLKDKAAEAEACALLKPEKDVDSMTRESLTGVFTGDGTGFPPCTAEAVMQILKFYGVPTAGKKAVVVGRSLVIGKPVAMLLLSANATVTICHSKTADLAEECRSADIIVAAAGSAKMLGADCFKEGQTVIDVGINVDAEGNMCGDVDFDAAEKIVSAITPVPGGVGSVTTAMLCSHTIEAAIKANKKK